MTHIAVAGAGIGGLVAALAMARTGHRVTLFERRQGLAEFGAGLQLSPNATRVLDSLGLLDRLRPIALEPQSVRVRRGRDGADIVRFPLGPQAVERYGAPFLLVLRPDLQGLLAHYAAAEPTIDLRFGVEVGRTQVTAGKGASLETTAGDLAADGFVDARGAGSAKPRHSGRTAWRALVPTAGLRAEHLRPDTNLWLGHRTHLVHYPVPGRERINVVAVTDDRKESLNTGFDLWSQPGDVDDLERAFLPWHPHARQLIDTSAEWRRWPLLVAAPLGRWSQGPLTVLGDAAHPMLPFLAQGASQAIEDAGVLASCLRNTSDVPAAFSRYEHLRRDRATKVQEASRQQARIYHLARPAADARDLALRLLGGARALARMDWLYGAT